MGRMALIDQIQQARRLSKNLLTLLQLESLKSTDLSPTFINPEKSIAEPAKLPGRSGKQIERLCDCDVSGRGEHGVQGRIPAVEDRLLIGD